MIFWYDQKTIRWKFSNFQTLIRTSTKFYVFGSKSRCNLVNFLKFIKIWFLVDQNLFWLKKIGIFSKMSEGVNIFSPKFIKKSLNLLLRNILYNIKWISSHVNKHQSKYIRNPLHQFFFRELNSTIFNRCCAVNYNFSFEM
jgi:hypothetical protein